MDDFRLTDEILAIMDGLDSLPPCCRTNLLKMTAAWERDIIELRRSRDQARNIAACLSVYVQQTIKDYPEDESTFGGGALNDFRYFAAHYKKWVKGGWQADDTNWGEARGSR